MGWTCAHASRRPQTIPVPRGPNIHLCVPAAKKSHPRAATDSSSTPRPWTPSTTSRMRSAAARDLLASAIASATRRTGTFTPVDECTHVIPTARVFGPSARRTRSTISSSAARAGSS